MTDGRNFFDHPIKNDIKTYDNIRKIATGQSDDYTPGVRCWFKSNTTNYFYWRFYLEI